MRDHDACAGPSMTIAIIAIVLAYLLGSVSFAIVASRLFRLPDPRTYGSRNPGATNVLRSGNRVAAIVTLVLDAAKGYLAVALAVWAEPNYGFGDAGVAMVAVAVFLGHLFPVFFRFKGGKGVATALGILTALQWWLGLFTLLTWIIVAAFFRYASLASLVSAVFAPFFYLLLVGLDPYALAILVISSWIVFRHRRNIGNLLSGREQRIGARAR